MVPESVRPQNKSLPEPTMAARDVVAPVVNDSILTKQTPSAAA